MDSTYPLKSLFDLGGLTASLAAKGTLLTSGEQVHPSTRSRMLYSITVFLELVATLRTIVQVVQDIRNGILFAPAVPERGLAHVHGGEVMLEDSHRLGDNETTLKSVLEVSLRYEKPMLIDNSGIGQSQSNGE